MHKASRNLIALVVMSVSAGCYHYTADIPGVLDTRSDGSTADASPPVLEDPELTREGLGALFSGEGVHADGAQVRIEDRHLFAGVTLLAPGVFLLTNDSSKEELTAALDGAALREVRVGHRYAGFDVLLSALSGIVPCVPLVLAPQPYTFTASGERVAAAGQAPANRPVAPPVDTTPPASDEAAPPAPDDAKDDDAATKDDDAAPKTEDAAPQDDDAAPQDDDAASSELGGAP